MYFFHPLLVISFASIVASASTPDPGQGLTVPTQQGPVLGTQVSSGVRRFLGIPFAVAKRWEPPQLPSNRNTTFAASDWGPSCPQSYSLSPIPQLNSPPVTQAEDCLSINIWVPSVNRTQGTAVMIWVYGGAFDSGTSNASTYEGQTLVQNHDDVSVVSFNYRLNIFGQPNAPQLLPSNASSPPQPQNFGLLDIDAAVQWVHDNIAAFGGDPERVILFGESAGGVAIDAYTFANPNDTRVKGVIEESGNLGVPSTHLSLNDTFDPTGWNIVAKSVGCGNETGTAQLDCLKALPFETLVNATASNNITFLPVVDNATIFADTRARAAAGNFLHVPLFCGTNANEGDLYSVSTQLQGLGHTIPVLTQLLADVWTQLWFACPTAQVANDRVNAGVRTWRYLYQGVFRDISPIPDLRSFHGSEIQLVFGTLSVNATKQEVALSEYMQGAWVAFARDPANGLVQYGWSPYVANGTVGGLGGFYNKTGLDFINGPLLDFTCNATDSTLYNIFGELLGLLSNAGLTIF